MRIVSFKGTLRMHVLNYVTSLVILGIHALYSCTNTLLQSLRQDVSSLVLRGPSPLFVSVLFKSGSYVTPGILRTHTVLGTHRWGSVGM